jgi:hypothetical protein
VSTGLAERSSRVEDSGAAHEPPLDGFGQTPVGASGVSHRGESAPEHPIENLRRLVGDEGGGLVLERREVHRGDDRVDVRVDQTGHERASGDVDSGGVGRADLTVADLDDPVVLDEDVLTRTDLPRNRIEQSAAFEEDLGHGLSIQLKHVLIRSVNRLHPRAAPRGST